jgi:putative ABC transport system substrate-binding protein
MAVAQGQTVVRRIGSLEYGPDIPEWVLKARADALARLGWVEGRNLYVERRYNSGGVDVFRGLAEELVRSRVEIIVTNGTGATLAAKGATTTIPIVFDSAGDPVLLGLVASLARPGGNVTGFSIASPETTTKRLSLLKELLPGIQRVGMLQIASDPYARATRRQFEQICESLRFVAIVAEIEEARRFSPGIQQLTHRSAQVLLIDDIVSSDELVDTATKAGLPTVADDATVVRDFGALCSYGSTWEEYFQRRADYINRILRGARPADLPVTQPTKFELAINLKTAKALAMTIPKDILLRADHVIR